MIHSQVIALRCAAALPEELSMSPEERRRNIRTGRQMYRKLYNLTLKTLTSLHSRQIFQLDCCADDEARRLLTGKSK
jgi:hypothetical protein